jgi:hypothetical protein
LEKSEFNGGKSLLSGVQIDSNLNTIEFDPFKHGLNNINNLIGHQSQTEDTDGCEVDVSGAESENQTQNRCTHKLDHLVGILWEKSSIGYLPWNSEPYEGTDRISALRWCLV